MRAPLLLAALSCPVLLTVPETAAQTTIQTLATPRLLQGNRLGNGGFESWSLGHVPDGPIPPDLWLPSGSNQGLFSQTNIEFTRLDSDSSFLANPGPAGRYFAELTPNHPGDFVSPSLENAQEFRRTIVTFALDVSAPFGVAVPEIGIDDGARRRRPPSACRIRSGLA